MDYNESRLMHYYARWVIDDANPPRQVMTSGPLDRSAFSRLIEQTRNPDCPITIVSVVSILKYPYDRQGISDRQNMIKK